MKLKNKSKYKKYSDVQMEHLYAKWLYTYGGASDYKTYESYVDEYDEDIDKYGKENFKREIICLCKTRGQTNYMEAKIQFDEDVLLNECNYNGIIAIKIGDGSVKNLPEAVYNRTKV